MWEVNELFDYWREHPPTHVLVAAYLMGGKNAASRKQRGQTTSGMPADNFDELSQAVFTVGGSIGKKLPAIYKT